MKICVLQVSYEGSTFECPECDPPRDLSGLLPEHSFHHEFLKKTTTFRQLQRLRRRNFDIYVNLCDVYPTFDVPSVDVIRSLEYLGLPYTGPDLVISSARKDLMKFVAHTEGLSTTPFVVVETPDNVQAACSHLRYPLFVKPNDRGDSFGIDKASFVSEPLALETKVRELTSTYDSTLIEEYIDGRELSVLVCADPDPLRPPTTFIPVEFRFPEGDTFKTFDMKMRHYHQECNVPCDDPALAERLRDAALRVFSAFSAVGYARVDFRVSKDNEIFFLEANFDCSVFYPEGYNGTADYILAFDGMGRAGFLRKIILEGIARHERKKKCFAVRQAKVGYGVFATRRIARGEIVVRGEERATRIVTREHVERTWNRADRDIFYRYAYPLGKGVYVFWDRDPAGWAPQNHSCDANTGFRGLDIVALRDIYKDEELTLDYATYCDEHATPFECICGSPKCRGRITGGRGLFA